MKLHKANINFSKKRPELIFPVEIRRIYNDHFTIFFRRDIFSSFVGWSPQSQHKAGAGYENYYGWNLWDSDDVRSMVHRLRQYIENPEIILEQLCPYCQNKLECLFSGECVECFPKWGL